LLAGGTLEFSVAQDGSSVGSAQRRVDLDCPELIDTSPALFGPTGHLQVTRAGRQQSSGAAEFGNFASQCVQSMLRVLQNDHAVVKRATVDGRVLDTFRHESPQVRVNFRMFRD